MTVKRLILVVLLVALVVVGTAGCCVWLPLVMTGMGMVGNG